MKRALLWLAVALVAPIRVSGQVPEGRREIVLDEPVYNGQPTNANLPVQVHVRNEGGSDGAGLCVISSALANGMAQGVPGLDVPGYDERSGQDAPGKGSLLWKTAKGRPGGYYPEKLASLVEETVAGEGYASHIGHDPAVLDRLSSLGYPIGATMNTGELYGWQAIHHMVSLIHFSLEQNLACYVDNNDPGKFHITSADEYVRRWPDGPDGWAWIWTRKPSVAGDDEADAVIVVVVAAAVVLLRPRHLSL